MPDRRRWIPQRRWNPDRRRRGSPRPTESMTSAGPCGAGRARPTSLESAASSKFRPSPVGRAPPYGIYNNRGSPVGPGAPGRHRWIPQRRRNPDRRRRGSPRPTKSMTTADPCRARRARPTSSKSATPSKSQPSSAGLAPPHKTHADRGTCRAGRARPTLSRSVAALESPTSAAGRAPPHGYVPHPRLADYTYSGIILTRERPGTASGLDGK